MTVITKLINGLTTSLFSLMVKLFSIGNNPGSKQTFSTTLDDGIVLDSLPALLPKISSEHRLNNDLGVFEVVSCDKGAFTVTIREVDTDFVFDIDVNLFDTLFKQVHE